MARTLTLARRDRVELPNGRGATLRVTRVRLWVTQEADRRDIVLQGGDSFTVERAGLTIAEAQDDATLVVVGSPRVTARIGRRAGDGWTASWGRTLRRLLVRAAALLRPAARSYVPYV